MLKILLIILLIIKYHYEMCRIILLLCFFVQLESRLNVDHIRPTLALAMDGAMQLHKVLDSTMSSRVKTLVKIRGML